MSHAVLLWTVGVGSVAEETLRGADYGKRLSRFGFRIRAQKEEEREEKGETPSVRPEP